MPIFSTKHIGYLERDFLDRLEGKIEEAQPKLFIPNNKSIRLAKINGISRFNSGQKNVKQIYQLLMEDILSGLHGERKPLIYLIMGEPTKINLYIGTFALHEDNTQKNTSSSLQMIRTSLKSAYPGIEIMDTSHEEFSSLREKIATMGQAGLMVGTPTIKPAQESQEMGQLDRLIRGLYGRIWCYMVIACPMAEKDIISFYNIALNELRVISDEEQSTASRSPVAAKYKEKIAQILHKSDEGKRKGMWHVSSYFFSLKEEVYAQTKALIKSVFSGKDSLPDPVIILGCRQIKENLSQFAQITTASPESPGMIHYPYKYLSLLHSGELTALVHLLLEEMPGYSVRSLARFDVAGHTEKKEKAIEIGEITDCGNRMGNHYTLQIKDLDRHALIVGVTGSGKTNTIFHLILQCEKEGLPFLVIEPAKTEYRKLLESEMRKELQIFTLGDEMTSPFRLNPFEILPGTLVQTHIDHLKSVFNASFIMYAPMPYVLERCIHEIYEDKGWNLITNENIRGIHRNCHPTLTDLFSKVDEVVNRLGYEAKITMDVKAALKTRINSLRIGGKGMMLDTRASIPIELILKKPTILELEQIGDDEEKAFIIGLVLAYQYEYYVSQGLKEGKSLQHLTVVEEAHRLFQNVPLVTETEAANSRGKSVETFCNILSEIRAYGEGFLISEQIPVKLAPDIIKNTNLKIMHRVVSEDDRRIMGATMNFDREQQRYISSLKVGEAAVYSEGDDESLLVKVPYRKIKTSYPSKTEENRVVKNAMEKFATELESIILPRAQCAQFCKNICHHYKFAKDITENREAKEFFSCYILSIVEMSESVLSEYPKLLQVISKQHSEVQENPDFLTCVMIFVSDWYFEKRGQQYGLRYDEIEGMIKVFMEFISGLIKLSQDVKKLPDTLRAKIKDFQLKYRKACGTRYPYSYCKYICINQACLYRYHSEALLQDPFLESKFNRAMREKDQIRWNMLARLGKLAVERMLSPLVSRKSLKKPALCFLMHKAMNKAYIGPYQQEIFMERAYEIFEEK